MKKLSIVIIIFSIWIHFECINAQKIEYGILGAGNVNFISQKSDYDIQGIPCMKPALSFNIGGFLRTNNRLINIFGSMEYSLIRNKFHQSFRDIVGNPSPELGLKIINHCFVMNMMGTVNIGKSLYAGAGLSTSLLLKSKLKVDGDLYANGEEIGNVFDNHSYKKVLYSIPITIGYEHQRINFFTRLNVGLTNRIYSDSYVKELDNTLLVGIGYKINKN